MELLITIAAIICARSVLSFAKKKSKTKENSATSDWTIGHLFFLEEIIDAETKGPKKAVEMSVEDDWRDDDFLEEEFFD